MSMDRLIEGYRRFRAELWPGQRARYEALADKGQSPGALVIACSDSRVDPQTVFGAAPGELFVVRNVAGLVPTYQPDAGYHGTSAALEYAVRVLKVPRVVVLGHVQCGGVQAMVEGAPAEARDFVEPWMSMARSVLRDLPDRHGPGVLDHCEVEVVRLSLANLLTFPWIAEAVEAGRVTLAGFRFEVRTGVLEHLEAGGMVPVT
jgi:carbonic anhydrase